MNSVLITGADGFLGRHIVRDLTSRGFNVLA
ncbi:MAG: NAD-dependent epimerase/dehydratase family protein, partial [Actinobacteria bacterium]